MNLALAALSRAVAAVGWQTPIITQASGVTHEQRAVQEQSRGRAHEGCAYFIVDTLWADPNPKGASITLYELAIGALPENHPEVQWAERGGK
jgi:hypothetical protein